MSKCNPDFYKKVQQLKNILEEAYASARKRKKFALKNVSLRQQSYSMEYHAALFSDQYSLIHAVKLAFPKDDHVIDVYSDTMESLWT